MVKLQLTIDDKLMCQTHIEEKEDLEELYLVLRKFGLKVEKKANLKT